MRTEVRDARMKAGLSQAALARLAGVPRRQVAAIESGGNVTLRTFEKVVSSVPGLRYLQLGDVEIGLRPPDEQNRQDVMDATAILHRLLNRLGGPVLPVGATRFDAGAMVDPVRARELQDLIGAILRGEAPTTEVTRDELRRLKKKKE